MTKRPIEDLEAANAFRDTLVARADGTKDGAPIWHGWAIFDAFLAGQDHATRDLNAAWLLQQLTLICDRARAAGFDLPGLHETCELVDQMRGRAPHSSVATIPFPLVVYFGNEADRQEFIDAVMIAKPNMKVIKI